MTEKKTIVRTDSLSTDRITGSFEDDYISCPICCNVLWKPIACQTCENAFCTKCIRLWLKDNPNKCPFQCRFQERKPAPILLKILSKLQLTCRHKTNGCSTVCLYEALEKHEQQECVYRLIQCPVCSKEMLQKDVESHADECPSREVACLKCGSAYRQRDGHMEEQCLHAQVKLLDEKLRHREDKPKKVMGGYSKMMDLYNRTIALSRPGLDDFVPSAPPTEEEEEVIAISSTAATNLNREEAAPRRSLHISTVDFSHISNCQTTSGAVPNGYGGFNWENAYFMKKDATANENLKGFRLAFQDSQQCIAYYNSRSAALSIRLPYPEQTFGLHSFEAICTYHPCMKLFITAYRFDIAIDTKHVTLTNKQLQLFEMDWEYIDRVVFKPEMILESLKPSTFALSSLNLVL